MVQMEPEEQIQRYTLRIDRIIFRKFRYIAEYNGHSANKEIELYIKKRVAKFENMYGFIDTNENS